MIGRADILRHIFEKLKIMSHRFCYLKTITNCALLSPVATILIFVATFSEMRRTIYINPSGHFGFNEIFCSSNFYKFFLQMLKLIISAHP